MPLEKCVIQLNELEVQISAEQETDVLVLGGGHAGIQCALSASECGASVIVIEQQLEDKIWIKGEQVATFNSEFLIKKGFGPYNLDDIIDEYCRCGAFRVDQDLITSFVKNSGEMLDHMVSLVDPEDDLLNDDQCNVHEAYGKPQYPILRGGFRTWASTLQFRGTVVNDRDVQYHVNELSRLPEFVSYAVKKAQELGAQWRYGQKVVALLADGKKIIGALATDNDGRYYQYLARNGVMLSLGRAGEMAKKLGVAAGGHVEMDLRHVPSITCIPHGAGFTAFLMLNARGERFCNESAAYGIGAAIDRQPPGVVCSVTDAKYMQQIRLSGVHHGDADFGMPEYIRQYEEDMSHVIDYGADGYEVRNLGLSERETARYWCANTLEELAEYLGYSGQAKETWLESIRRYNAMCYQHKDLDYNKDADTLLPIDQPPFYGAKTMNKKYSEKAYEDYHMHAPALGLVTDKYFRVVDDCIEPIDGLYAAGDAMGGRFSVYYPTPCGGAYVGMAMTHGRLAGQIMAKGNCMGNKEQK